jgi:hypothetical protein
VTTIREETEMLPTYEFVKIKIEEDLQQAARERRAREAVISRPRPIDFAAFGERIRDRLLGGPRPGRPAAAGA